MKYENDKIKVIKSVEIEDFDTGLTKVYHQIMAVEPIVQGKIRIEKGTVGGYISDDSEITPSIILFIDEKSLINNTKIINDSDEITVINLQNSRILNSRIECRKNNDADIKESSIINSKLTLNGAFFWCDNADISNSEFEINWSKPSKGVLNIKDSNIINSKYVSSGKDYSIIKTEIDESKIEYKSDIPKVLEKSRFELSTLKDSSSCNLSAIRILMDTSLIQSTFSNVLVKASGISTYNSAIFVKTTCESFVNLTFVNSTITVNKFFTPSEHKTIANIILSADCINFEEPIVDILYQKGDILRKVTAFNDGDKYVAKSNDEVITISDKMYHRLVNTNKQGVM